MRVFTTEDMIDSLGAFRAKYMRPLQERLARKWERIACLRRAAGVHDFGPTDLNRESRRRIRMRDV